MQSVCLLPDLHFSPPLTADDSIHIQHIRTAVAAQCDLLIYVGDILTMDQCTSIAACASFYPTVRTVVDTIGMPFLFTLGNHDGDPSSAERTQLKAVLNASAHHVGVCDPLLDACVHPVLDVATLYSGKEHCHQYTHWGCPSAVQAAWIDAALSARPTFSLLVTHIPPPNVLGLAVDGVVGEFVSCWDVFADDDAVLPMRRPALHAFGHDHSNLFVSARESLTNVTYVAAFKSGRPPSSYDAAFYPGSSGFTVLSVPTPGERSAARLNRTFTFTGEDLGRFYVQRATVTQARCDLL